MKQNQMLWIIIGALGIGGLFLLLKKQPSISAGVSNVGVSQAQVQPQVSQQVPTTCREKAIFLAQQQLGLSESELTVRSLLPQDLGLTTWSLNLAGLGWNNGVINTTIQDNRFCCITGITYSGTSCEQIRVRVGASTVAQFSTERPSLITTTHHIDIAEILAQQNLPVVVDAYASVISATDNVILEGYTIEKRGMLLA